MSKEELRSEINKMLDHLPVNSLADIHSFLKNIRNKEIISLLDKATIEKVLRNDKVLLQKLAKMTS